MTKSTVGPPLMIGRHVKKTRRLTGTIIAVTGWFRRQNRFFRVKQNRGIRSVRGSVSGGWKNRRSGEKKKNKIKIIVFVDNCYSIADFFFIVIHSRECKNTLYRAVRFEGRNDIRHPTRVPRTNIPRPVRYNIIVFNNFGVSAIIIIMLGLL